MGFGRIAQEVAKRLKAFKPKRMLYTARSNSREQEAREIGVERAATLDQLLTQSKSILLSYQKDKL